MLGTILISAWTTQIDVIYLFSFREVQLFKKGFSHNEQTYNHNYHHQKIIQTLYNQITSYHLHYASGNTLQLAPLHCCCLFVHHW